MANKHKVFCIGLNKTGTSSMHRALEHLGYRVSGPDKDLLRNVRSGETTSTIRHTRKFDAFQDWPYPLVFKELHREYGSSGRYILTYRESPERWFASVENHARTSRLVRGQWLPYGYYRPFGRERQYIDIYNTHNEEVRAYFLSGPGADAPFLEMCLDHGDGWQKLCTFLGHELPQIPFPHTNTAARRKKGWPVRRAINRVVEPLYRAYVRIA